MYVYGGCMCVSMCLYACVFGEAEQGVYIWTWPFSVQVLQAC